MMINANVLSREAKSLFLVLPRQRHTSFCGGIKKRETSTKQIRKSFESQKQFIYITLL